MLVLAIDDQNMWVIISMCRPDGKFDVQNEWIWIMARDISLSEEDEKNAMEALMKKLPSF
jgi:hypothetical protein